MLKVCYVCERRICVCERARMNYVLYGPSYVYVACLELCYASFALKMVIPKA